MAIELEYRYILSDKFHAALKKLADFADFPSQKAAYNVAKIIELVERELKIALKSRESLFAKYKKYDETYTAENPAPFTPQEKLEATEKFKAEIDELLSMKVSIDERREKIKFSDLAKLQLAPSELICAECIIDFEELLDGKASPLKAVESRFEEPAAAQP